MSYKEVLVYYSTVLCISLSLFFVFLSAPLVSPIPFPENGAKHYENTPL